MKIKAIARSKRQETRETRIEPYVVRRNLDPAMHPFAGAREHQRAIVSAKLDRMMAKPFVCALDAHRDGITALGVPRTLGALQQTVSGSADGELKLWDLASRKSVWSTSNAHTIIRGLCFTRRGDEILSCGDRCVKRWRPLGILSSDDHEPLGTWGGSPKSISEDGGTLNDVDGAPSDDSRFITAGAEGLVQVWDASRRGSILSWPWTFFSGVAQSNVYRAKWNPAEVHIIAACGRDRGLTFYDERRPQPLRRIVLASRANAIAWNPRDPMSIVCGCEDHQAALFDVRKLTKPTMLFRDHLAPIVDLSFAPTGLEFVSASTDKTIRIFRIRGDGVGRSRDIYHTQRMQALTAVRFTPDAAYIISGSDDANVRLWKSEASAPSAGPLHPAHRQDLRYRKALLAKYKHMPDVKRIVKQRHLPKLIKKLKQKHLVQEDKKRRKLDNTIKHSNPHKSRQHLTTSARERAVIKEQA